MAFGDVHERLCRKNAFRRSFLATGTQLPVDHSADSEVQLQGLEFDYEKICNAVAISTHKTAMEADKAKLEAEKIATARLRAEREQALQDRFQNAVEIARNVQTNLEPLVVSASSPCFSAIAAHIQADFICAGSYPAFLIAHELRKLTGYEETVKLKFNDIDVYYGNWNEGEISRGDCTQINIENINKEVNLIKCSYLNTKCLIENFDINVISVCVCVRVVSNRVVAAEQNITPRLLALSL